MNTIARSTPLAEYPEMNVAALLQSSSDAGNVVIEVRRLFTQTNYLPSLHARIADLDNAMRDATFRLREAALSVNTQLLIHARALSDYQTELDGASQPNREEIQEDISRQAARVVQVVRKGYARLQRLHASMDEPVDRAPLHHYLAQLQAERHRLPADILEIEAKMSSLGNQRHTLTEAMALIEAKSLARVGKDTLLTGQCLAKLAIAGPEIVVVEKAIELAQHLLEKLDTQISYFGLMDARNTLRKQINELLTRVHEKTAQLRTANMKSDLINAAQAFDHQRRRYVSEFVKVIIAKRSFLEAYDLHPDSEQSHVKSMVEDAVGLAHYLKRVT